MKKFFRWFRLESYKIIHQFIRITWKCGWSVAVCIVLILALWFMDQGSDILIGLVGNTDGFLKGHLYVGLGYAFATLLAFFIWYMPKLIITDDSNKSGDVGIGQVSTFKKLKIRVKDNLQRSKNIPTPDKNKVHWMFSFLEDYQFPRLLGISVFFIIGIACLNIHYQSFAKSDSLLKIVFENRVSILFLLIIVFGFFLSWLERKYKTREKLSLKLKYLPADILMLIVLGVIVYLAYYLSLQNRLMMLGIGMMLMAFPFSAFVVLRRKITSFPRLHRLKLYHLVLILALLLLLTFVYFNLGFYSPGLLFEYPFGVLFGLLSLLVFSLTFFTYLTRKWNFTFQAFIIIFLLSMYMPSARHYEVRKVEQNSALSKVDLDSYFTKWLSDRNLLGDADSSMSTTDSFHVFLVAAEGGGSTLGLWSSLVLSELNMNPKFYEHCFMMTGASGGMAGATHFVSLKNHLFEDTTRLPAEKFPEIFSKTFTNDFLSGSLCYMFGRDVLNAIIPLGGIDDRAALLEKEWSLELYKNLYDQK
ncbi:MAG: hypothetical protein R2879_22085, partial [Saprospiraceae bacterium]